MKIEIPEQVRDCEVIASVSGGKDSAALVLALREAEIPARFVFADTGWEHPDTYRHIDTMRERLGIRIDVVGAAGGMVGRARHRAGFPMRLGRWCTEELKLKPVADYIIAAADASQRDVVSAVGVRAEESEARSRMPVVEWSKLMDCNVWRPLLSWSVTDVIMIHRRHGLPMNPLYHRGHDRVGCYPCLFSSKDEVRLIAENDPWRIEQIKNLEKEFTDLRASRNLEKPGRYGNPTATFFQKKDGAGNPAGIDEVVEWSKTARGGKQFSLLDNEPSGGCMRWGLCETTPPPPPAPQPQ